MPDVGKRIIILWYIGEKKLPGGTMKAKKVTAIILAGALPTAAMSIFTDWSLGIIERKLDPTSKKKN